MSEHLHTFFESAPLAAVSLALALGYLVGKIRLGAFVLGPVAATLLVAIAIGQVGVSVSGEVKTLAFALFIYALGYMIGPQFVSSLGRATLKQVHLTIVGSLVVVITVWGLSMGFSLDKGTAAGILSGGATESAAIGTASDALATQPLPKEEIARLTANIGIAYAITYLFGTFTVIFFASSLAPRLLGIDLARASRDYEQELGGGPCQPSAGQFEAFRRVVARVYEVSIASDGRLVRDVEKELEGVVIERVVRGTQSISVEPTLKLHAGDHVAVAGRRGQVIHRADVTLGPEMADPSGVEFVAETRDVVVTSHTIAGRTIHEVVSTVDPQTRRGVFLTGLTRLNQPLPLAPNTRLSIGDVARIVGSPGDVERASKLIGYPVPPADKTDFLYFGLGLFSGFALGLLGVPFAGSRLGLGTGGGCLIAGLIFGWLRARRPTFGQLPAAAALYLRDFGLAVFVACIGLATGPEALKQVVKYGMVLPVAGIAVSLVPGLVSLYYGKYVLRMNPVILCGSLCGRQASTPALNAVTLAAGNNAPVLGYTVPYTIANILLTLAGPVVVLIVR
ncbi:MAG TPA: aspartate-alanine antiporter [Terriglobales bacterium]|nr:aspartate-alanine antiporter [Terriglobales bacterium]